MAGSFLSPPRRLAPYGRSGISVPKGGPIYSPSVTFRRPFAEVPALRTKRKTCNCKTIAFAEQFDRLISEVKGTERLTFPNGATSDIIAEILDVFKTYRKDAERASYLFAECGDPAKIAACIHGFLRKNIRYKVDSDGEQLIKRPARVWRDKVSDCKGYSILAGSILSALKIPFSFRFVSWREGENYTHVYLIVHDGKERYFPLDACLPKFNSEKRFHQSKDFDMSKIYRIEGIGDAEAEIFGPESDNYSAAQWEAKANELQYRYDSDQMAGLFGPDHPYAAIFGAAAELARDYADAGDDADVIAAISAMESEGLYATEAEIGTRYAQEMGVQPRAGMTRKLRRRLIKLRSESSAQPGGRACMCRKVDAMKSKARNPFTREYLRRVLERQKRASELKRAQVKGIAMADDAILGLSEADFNLDSVAGIGRKRKKRGGLKKFFNKVTKGVKNTVKKAAKGLQRGALVVPRAALTPILRSRAAAGLLYTFLSDQEAANLPAKVQAKRRRQLKILDALVKGLAFKRPTVIKYLRIGIKKKFKKEPREVLKDLFKGKISGIGIDPLTMSAASAVLSSGKDGKGGLLQPILDVLGKIIPGLGSGKDAEPNADDAESGDGSAAESAAAESAGDDSAGGESKSGGGEEAEPEDDGQKGGGGKGRSGEKKWYQKPLVLVGIGAGVLAVAGGVYAYSRRRKRTAPAAPSVSGRRRKRSKSRRR